MYAEVSINLQKANQKYTIVDDIKEWRKEFEMGTLALVHLEKK